LREIDSHLDIGEIVAAVARRIIAVAGDGGGKGRGIAEIEPAEQRGLDAVLAKLDPAPVRNGRRVAGIYLTRTGVAACDAATVRSASFRRMDFSLE
jgi:hypothetical protein